MIFLVMIMKRKVSIYCRNSSFKKYFYIYGWRQVGKSKALGTTAESSRPEITQVLFRKNENLQTDELERNLFISRKEIEKLQG